jgi:phosphohistidine phosphatase
MKNDLEWISEVNDMKQLLVLRHAKSSWKDSTLSDFNRPLNERGKKDAPRMGKLLSKMDLVPDLIIASAAKRAKLTAEAVSLSSGYEGDILETQDLYMGMPEDYIAVLNQVPDIYTRVLVVGHNPGIEDFVEDLTDQWHRMPTAALAYIELDIKNWQAFDEDSEGELLDIWLPKEI